MNGRLALATVFFASGAVLVLELMAVRLLGPYVGLSLQTYTAIIGTVLAAIAFGAWVGGRLADQIAPLKLLGPALIGGGLLALVSVPVVRALGDSMRSGGDVGVVLLAAAGFFLPAAVLSTVTPIVAKARLRTVADAGSVIGGLSAAATAGALAGTFLTGFVLIEAFPSTTVIVACAALLIVAGAVLAVTVGRRAAVALLALLGIPLAALALATADDCDRETGYSCIRLEPDAQNPNARVLMLDTGRHSTVDPDDPSYLGFAYTRVIAAVVDGLGEGPLRALHVGGGGFTLPRWLADARPGSQSVVLELDGGLVDFDRDRLGLVTGPDLVARVGDARVTLPDEPAGAYDVVVGDAFSGLSVPWHLTTEEFAQEVRERLRPGGIYAINVIDYPPLGFARAEAETLRRVFGNVAVIARTGASDNRAGGNVVLVASDQPLDLDAIAARVAAGGDGDREVFGGTDVERWIDGAEPLTDDHAPVDQLLTRL